MIRRAFLSGLSLSIAGICAGVAEERLSARLERELVQARPLWQSLAKIPKLAVLEGLPHPAVEPKTFKAELAKGGAIQIGDDWLYDTPLHVIDADLKRLRELLAVPGALNVYVPKSCGGFHPDYAVVGGEGAAKCHLLICFTCGSIEIVTPEHRLLADMSAELRQGLRGVLAKYVARRPPPTEFVAKEIRDLTR
jgi:hypothetical protein